MGELIKWLMHEDRKDLYEVLFASVLNIIFLALISLLLWPLGGMRLALRLAKGYVILWIIVYIVSALVNLIQKLFRVDMYTHPDAYVGSNLAASSFLQVGWAAFAALAVHSFVAAAPVWVVIILYIAGALSCLITFVAVSSVYQGHIYKLVSLPLALVGFIVCSVWPAVGRALYGWFFELF